VTSSSIRAGANQALNNSAMRDRGIEKLSDEVIVVVKREACEDMVTYLRIKLSESDKDFGDEGWNMLTVERPY